MCARATAARAGPRGDARKRRTGRKRSTGSRARDVPRALASVPSALMRDVSASGFWEDLYARGADGWRWDVRRPPLVDLRRDDGRAGGRVAVPAAAAATTPLPRAARLRRHGLRLLPGRGRRRADARAHREGRRRLRAARHLRLPADYNARFRRRLGVHLLLRDRSARGATSTCRRWRGSMKPAAGCSPASFRSHGGAAAFPSARGDQATARASLPHRA